MIYTYSTAIEKIRIDVSDYWYETLIEEDEYEHNKNRKEKRHRSNKELYGASEYENDDPYYAEMFDKRACFKDEIEIEERETYNTICIWIRDTLAKYKTPMADAFIVIRLDGMSVNEYAARNGLKASTVSKWLARAAEHLKDNYSNLRLH